MLLEGDTSAKARFQLRLFTALNMDCTARSGDVAGARLLEPTAAQAISTAARMMQRTGNVRFIR